MVVVIFTAATSMIPCMLGMPAMGHMARPWAVEQVTAADTALAALEQAQAKKDWAAMQEHANEVAGALRRLSAGPALRSLVLRDEQNQLEPVRGHLRAAQYGAKQAQEAISEHDAGRLDAALRELRQSLEPLRAAAKKAAP
jgi:hypothetical protein